MTKRDRQALESYIRSVADAMGLRDWEVLLGDEPAERGDCANCRITYGRKHAVICVPADFSTSQSPEDQRDSIVHELVHCHLEPAASMVQNDLTELLGKPADGVFFAAWTRNFEYGVDGLAGAIAKHLPLIDWPVSGS